MGWSGLAYLAFMVSRLRVGWLLLRFILDYETGDEAAVEEVECWEEFVGEEDV